MTFFDYPKANKGIEVGTPWQNGPVLLEFAMTGLGPIHIRIAQFDYMKDVLEKVLYEWIDCMKEFGFGHSV